MVERRRYQRYKVQSGAYAVFNPKKNKPCRIVDISLDGVAVLFMENTKDMVHSSEEMTILMQNDDLCVERIPVEIISEFAIASGLDEDDDPSPKRIGMKFGELTPEQRMQLEQFIWANNIGEA
jgi:c-di-GMP-binding flagellar brake protein YcgR